MNIVKVYGGLGNQMFQYAFGMALMKRNKEVVFDISYYADGKCLEGPYPRFFRLDKFNLKHPVFLKDTKRNGMTLVKENKIGYDEKVLELKTEAFFEGYWQYYKYYIDILPDLREQFTVKKEYYTEEFLKYEERILKGNCVTLHIRRGDYFTHTTHKYSVLSPSYSFDALQYFDKNYDLYIFSDDLEWCKKVFKSDYFNRNIYFVDLEDYLCMQLMKSCANNIIANSTFSWWAAFLNENENKKVICPRHYLGDSLEISENLRYPKEWIKIYDYVDHIS